MNDIRNNTEYSCGTVPITVSNPTVADIVDESDSTILYVAGECQYNTNALGIILTVQYSYALISLSCTVHNLSGHARFPDDSSYTS